jgi:hypothetical protein
MKLRVAGAAITLILLLAAAWLPAAQARGFAGHAFFFPGRFHSALLHPQWWWRQGFLRYRGPALYGPSGNLGYAPLYGGLVDYSPAMMDDFGYYPMPAPVQFVARPPAPAPAPTCQPSVEVVTVPAEEGGTRQITVRRCMP